MIKVIGQINCSSCEVVKNILNQKNIKYEYILIDDLDKEIKNNYIRMARECGKLKMPLIIKNNMLVDLKEVI